LRVSIATKNCGASKINSNGSFGILGIKSRR